MNMNSKTIDNVPEPSESDQEKKTLETGEPGDAAQGMKVVQMAQLQADLAAAKSESDQWKDRYLRKAAEYENFRKRCDRERSEIGTTVKSSVLAEFLPILDVCERALKSFTGEAEQTGALRKYREGVELLFKQLGDTLSRLGVTALEAKGQKFDPHFHEAITYQETLEYEDNTVIEELRRGYLLKERLLRPAQVVVASHPKAKADEGAAQK